MYNEELRKELQDIDDELILFDNRCFDDSIIGISTDGRVVYDLRKMIEEVMQEDEVDEITALDFIETNTIRANSYFSKTHEHAPIIVDTLMFDYIDTKEKS